MDAPLVVASLEGTKVEEVIREAARAAMSGADLVEVRFDRLWLVPQVKQVVTDDTENPKEESEGKKPSLFLFENDHETLSYEEIDADEKLATLLNGMEMPVVFSCRRKGESGFFPGSEDERLAILEKAIDAGVSWLDLEIDIEPEKRKTLLEKARASEVEVIASIHNMEKCPESGEISTMIDESRDLGDIVKACFRCRDQIHGLWLVEASWNLEKRVPHTIMGLGPSGDWPRLHAPLLGQKMVYSVLANDYSLPERGLVNAKEIRIAWDVLEYIT